MFEIMLLDHIEKYLGTDEKIYRDASGKSGVGILHFENVPQESLQVFITHGVSPHTLAIEGDKITRREFMFVSDSDKYLDVITWFLFKFSDRVLELHIAPEFRSVIDFKGPIFLGSVFSGVYVTVPSFFEADMIVYEEMDPHVVLCMLMPIYQSEMEYIQQVGGDAFEDFICEGDCDFWDLERPPLVFPSPGAGL